MDIIHSPYAPGAGMPSGGHSSQRRPLAQDHTAIRWRAFDEHN